MANSGSTTTQPTGEHFDRMSKNLENLSNKIDKNTEANQRSVDRLSATLKNSITNFGKFTVQSIKDVSHSVHQEVNLGTKESTQRAGGAAGGLAGVVLTKALQESQVAQKIRQATQDKINQATQKTISNLKSVISKRNKSSNNAVYNATQGEEDLPKAAAGGLVKKTGKAIVHAGEKITRKSSVDQQLATLQAIQSGQLEIIASLNNVSQSLTDPSAAGGFFKSVGDTAKVLFPLFGGGMYKNDIKKSSNPFATQTDALLQIYRWQRLYGELSKRQLNELIKTSGGEQQDVYGKRGVLFEFLIKNRIKLLDKLAAHIKKKEGVGKKPIFAKAAKGFMGGWIGKALMQDPEMFEMAQREATLSHGSKMLEPGEREGPKQNIAQKIGSWSIFGQKEAHAPHKLMKKSFGSAFEHESLIERPDLDDLIGRASQIGVKCDSLIELKVRRGKLISSKASEGDISKIDQKIEDESKSVWVQVYKKEQQKYGSTNQHKESIISQSSSLSAGGSKKESAVYWLIKIYGILRSGGIKSKGKNKNVAPEDSLAKISESTAAIAEVSKKSEERAIEQAKETKKASVWDKVKDKGKGGISKILDFLNRISGMVIGLIPLIGLIAMNPKAALAALKWTFSAPMNFMKMMWMYFGKFSKLFTPKALISTFKAIKNIPKMLHGVFDTVKGIFSVFKDAKGLFKGLKAVGGLAKIGGKGLLGSAGKTILKKIPGVGAIMGIIFGISRFRKGDILGGLGEIVSGIASIFPGPGTLLSLFIDGLLIARDLHKAKENKETTKVSKTSAEAGASLGKKSPMMQTLKLIPGIGLIMGISYGISRFRKGDILGGLGEIVSGITSTFPVVGTGVSMIIDALLNFRDIKKMKAQKGEKFNFFAALWNAISDVILALPKAIIGVVDKISSYLGKISDDVINGIKKIFIGIGSSISQLFTSDFWIKLAKGFWGGSKKDTIQAKATRIANDYVGTAKEITTASGQVVQLSPGDIATIKKSQPSISERTPSTNMADGVRQNAIAEQYNSSAATIKASKQMSGSLERSTTTGTNNINNVINKITKISTNNSSQSGGGGPRSLPLWQDISALLVGQSI